MKEARQAVAYAIDYDGIINSMLGGQAMRCASFIPIGLFGSTRETTKEIGYHQDLDRSRQLLQKAGFPDGFEFKLSYGDAARCLGFPTRCWRRSCSRIRLGWRSR